VSALRFSLPGACTSRARPVAGARGFALILALLMLVAIVLAATAIMRNAVSGDQVVTNSRLQAQAGQYAQLALRWCEMQLALAPAARSVTPLPAAMPPAWTVQRNWTTSGPDAAHTLSATDIGSSVLPRSAPQCLLEATAMQHVYTVTARGFSPDFHVDAGTGSTRSGGVVWVQATVYTDVAGAMPGGAGTDPAQGAAAPAGCAADCGLRVRQRVWQQLLTPPF
jgi:hypothetical protein